MVEVIAARSFEMQSPLESSCYGLQNGFDSPTTQNSVSPVSPSSSGLFQNGHALLERDTLPIGFYGNNRQLVHSILYPTEPNPVCKLSLKPLISSSSRPNTLRYSGNHVHDSNRVPEQTLLFPTKDVPTASSLSRQSCLRAGAPFSPTCQPEEPSLCLSNLPYLNSSESLRVDPSKRRLAPIRTECLSSMYPAVPQTFPSAVKHQPLVESSSLPSLPLLPADLQMKYQLMHHLGKGGSGFVYSAVRLCDGKKVAIKFIYRTKIPANRLAYDREFETGCVMVLPMEIYILRRLHHENVIEFVEFSCDRTFFYLITELHGTSWPTRMSSLCAPPPMERPMDLFECIESQGPMSQELAFFVFKQVVEACRYLKSMNVWHMDIKDENIVIDTNFHIKIIDFGSANIIPAYNHPSPEVAQQALFRRFYGTLIYAPPEVLKSQSYRADLAEIWCLGVLFYTILTGEPPFRTAEAAMHDPLPYPTRVQLNEPAWKLLHHLLQKEPERRPSLDEILNEINSLNPRPLPPCV